MSPSVCVVVRENNLQAGSTAAAVLFPKIFSGNLLAVDVALLHVLHSTRHLFVLTTAVLPLLLWKRS